MRVAHSSPARPLALLLLICLSLLGSPLALAEEPRSLPVRLQAFLDWLGTLENAGMHQLLIRDLGKTHGGLGLFAVRQIPVDTTILTFPAGYVIHPQRARESMVGYFLEEFPQSEANQLILYLLHEKFANPDSFFKPYLDLLPQDFANPLFYTEEELDELKGTALYDFAKRRKASLQDKFEELKPLVADFDDVFPEGTFTLPNFLWAASAVFSRTMAVGLKTIKGEWRKVNAIVPLLDLPNTGYPDEINTVCRTSEDGTTIFCHTSRPVAEGEEILISYNKEGLKNSEYLLDYGIAFEQNELDKLSLPMPDIVVEAKNIKEEMMQKLDQKVILSLKEDTQKMEAVVLDWRRPLTELKGLMTFLRLLHLEVNEVTKHQLRCLNALNQFKTVNKKNERKVADFLASYLQERLDQYPTTLEEDEKILDQLYQDPSPAMTNRKFAVIGRVAEKKLLHYHVSELEKHKAQYAPSGEFKVNPAWSKSEL